MQFNSKPPMAMETEVVEAPEAEVEETTMVPASMLAGQSVKPGDVVRFEVVDVGGEGMISMKYAKANSKTSGIAGLTAPPTEMEQGEI